MRWCSRPAIAPTTTESSADWEALARLGQPIILYMPMTQLAGITAALMKGGMAADTPAALLQSATTEHESGRRQHARPPGRRTRATHGIGSPAIVVIGAVAGLRAAGAGRPGRLAMTPRPDRLGGSLGRRQDDGGARPDARLRAARAHRAALQVRAGLHRSRLPRLRRRPAELQSRQLGDVAAACCPTSSRAIRPTSSSPRA